MSFGQNTRQTSSIILAIAVGSLVAGNAHAAFPPPVQADPATQYTAAISPNYSDVQSFSRILYFDINNPIAQYPKLYWFKYHSDGASVVKFDTLGSNFGTGSGGAVLGSSNQSQIAVYKADGTKVAISKGTKNLAGDPVTAFPGYVKDSRQWYVPHELSETYFQPSPPSNPHWAASPTDPMPFTGWSAPGNEGNSQKYYPPYYRTSLNEFHVWSTALSSVILDNNDQPVINPDTGSPYTQPTWRPADRTRHGLATPWNRFGVLPEGDYYIAIASPSLTFAGDTYGEEYLRAPVHFDYSTFQNYQSVLSGPLGTFQYYEPPTTSGTSNYQGTINFNVTNIPLGVNVTSQWSVNQSGSWGDAGKWQNGVPNGVDSTANLLGAISGAKTLTLSEDTVLGTLNFDNASSYSIEGSNSLGFFSSQGTSSINVQNGSHQIGAPLRLYNAITVNTVTGTALAVNQPLKYYTAVAISKTGNGTLQLLGGGGQASDSMPVFATLNVTDGAVVADGNHHFGSITLNASTKLRKQGGDVLVTNALNINGTAQLDLSGGGVVWDYSGTTSPLAGTIIPQILSGRTGGGWNGNGINSSAAAANPVTGIGYTDTAITGATTFITESTDSTAILLRYTLLGDANVDGTVSSEDFNTYLGFYGVTSDARWYQGDFDYNGKINTLDFNYIAGNFGGVMPSAVLGSVVPEPAIALLALLPGAACARRRVRRH